MLLEHTSNIMYIIKAYFVRIIGYKCQLHTIQNACKKQEEIDISITKKITYILIGIFILYKFTIFIVGWLLKKININKIIHIPYRYFKKKAHHLITCNVMQFYVYYRSLK